NLAALRRVLEQRNSLLKRIAAGEEAPGVLEAWNAELVAYGSDIAGARARAVEELRPYAAESHAEIAAGERLELAYVGPPASLGDAVEKSLGDDLPRWSIKIVSHR